MSRDVRPAGPAEVPPLHGEPIPLEFANTVFPVHGALKDALATPERLAWWLDACRGRLSTRLPDDVLGALTPADTECFVLLRDATRRLISAYVHKQAPEAWDVALVNRVSSTSRPWLLLRWGESGGPRSARMCTAPPVVAVQAEIAQSLIEVLDGAAGVEPRACRAPGCVFFFDHTRSRREWCSIGCGNRARVARHYARRRGTK